MINKQFPIPNSQFPIPKALGVLQVLLLIFILAYCTIPPFVESPPSNSNQTNVIRVAKPKFQQTHLQIRSKYIMKSTSQNKVKKAGFITTSGIKAGDCKGGCFPIGPNRTIGIDCHQCPPETPELLCTGNASCNENGPAGKHCECI
jgi:hypothetical protein